VPSVFAFFPNTDELLKTPFPPPEIGCILGEGWVVSRISSRNMHLDNPMAMVKIALVNLHQYDK